MKNKSCTENKILTHEDASEEILRFVWCQLCPCLIDTIILNIPAIKGNREWLADEYFNTFYTHNISHFGLECMQNLLQKRQIHMWNEDKFQCYHERYFPYGRNIVNPKRKIPYKEQRWQPAVISLTVRGIDRLIG